MIKSINVKELLAEGLIEMARHKSIEKITVTDIVEVCGTTRRTFYNHFIDKYDLISWIYTSRAEMILSCFNDSDSWKDCMIHTYQALLDNREFFENVLNQEGQNSFYQQFSAHTYQYMRDMILAEMKLNRLPEEIDYALTAHVFGQVNCAMKWLREGCIISPVQMATYNIANMPAPIRQYFL